MEYLTVPVKITPLCKNCLYTYSFRSFPGDLLSLALAIRTERCLSHMSVLFDEIKNRLLRPKRPETVKEAVFAEAMSSP